MAKKQKSGCPEPQGLLLIIGGREDKTGEQNEPQPETYAPEEILQKFLSLTGKRKPTIELITTGSSLPKESFSDYEKAFAKLGTVKLNHIHHTRRQEVLEDDLLDRVKAADAFFLSGGDQLKLTSLYGGTDFLQTLKQKYIDRKTVIAGTSAGAMAMSTPMIYAGSEQDQDIAGKIKLTTGLEFMKDVCIDTHFQGRNRFIRLAQVIATNPMCTGIGLAEDTAVLVTGSNSFEVLGSGMATIIEGFEISQANYGSFDENLLVSIRDLRVHLISKGDKFTLTSKNPQHA